MKKKSNEKSTESKSTGNSGGNNATATSAAADRIASFIKRKRDADKLRASVGVESTVDGTNGAIEQSSGADGKRTNGIKPNVGASAGDDGRAGTTGAGKRGKLGNDNAGAGAGAGAGVGVGVGAGAADNFAQVGEVPARVIIGKNKKKPGQKQKDEQAEVKFQAAAMSALIQIFLSGLFQSIGIFRREPHWALGPKEAEALAKQTESCLQTLPKGTYDELQKLFSRYLPWVGLALTAGAIIAPRIEAKAGTTDRTSTAASESGASGSGTGGRWEFEFANPYRNGSTNGKQPDNQRNTANH